MKHQLVIISILIVILGIVFFFGLKKRNHPVQRQIGLPTNFIPIQQPQPTNLKLTERPAYPAML